MDDSYAIRLAKTKLRDAYNNGSVSGVLSVFADRYSDMSDSLASFYGAEARAVLKQRMKKLFARYDANWQSQSSQFESKVPGLLTGDGTGSR